jgi:hypothetical protein
MVLGRIEVREGHVGADWDYRQEGPELQVLLRHHVAASGMRRTGRTRRIKRHDGIADWASGCIDDTHVQGGRDKRRCCAGKHQRTEEVTHHWSELSR